MIKTDYSPMILPGISTVVLVHNKALYPLLNLAKEMAAGGLRFIETSEDYFVPLIEGGRFLKFHSDKFENTVTLVSTRL